MAPVQVHSVSRLGPNKSLPNYAFGQTGTTHTNPPVIPPLAAFGGESVSSVRNSLAQSEDFARVHDVLRVKRALDRPHRLKRRRTVLRQEILYLALPDAMLTGAGPLGLPARTE